MHTYFIILNVFKKTPEQELLGSNEIVFDCQWIAELTNKIDDLKKEAIQKLVGKKHDKENYFATIHQIEKIE